MAFHVNSVRRRSSVCPTVGSASLAIGSKLSAPYEIVSYMFGPCDLRPPSLFHRTAASRPQTLKRRHTMNTNLIKLSALTGLIAAGGVATMVSAQTVAEQTGLTEAEVIEIALTEVPGEVTEVEMEERRGNSYFEVEILAEDGTEMEVKIAADTGDILKVESETDDDKDCDKDDDDDDGEDA